MTILLRTDGDNYPHQIWAQEQAASCAVASIWMARNQARQQSVNETEWDVAWSIYKEIVAPLSMASASEPGSKKLQSQQFPEQPDHDGQHVLELRYLYGAGRS